MNQKLKKLIFTLSLSASLGLSQGLLAKCGDKPCCDKDTKTEHCKDKETKAEGDKPEHHAE